MAKIARGIASVDAGRRPIPRYPLGPGTLEISVEAVVAEGKVVAWESSGQKSVREAIEDIGGLDLEAAKALLFAKQMDAPFVDPAKRSVTARGSVEFTEYALERAHRATILLIGDPQLPAFLNDGWVSGKIGVPKGEPPVRQVNLHRPGE